MLLGKWFVTRNGFSMGDENSERRSFHGRFELPHDSSEFHSLKEWKWRTATDFKAQMHSGRSLEKGKFELKENYSLFTPPHILTDN